MTKPDYKIVPRADVDDAADIWYNNVLIRIHEVAFNEDIPDQPILQVRYTIIHGKPTEDVESFQKAIGDIVLNILENKLLKDKE